MTVLRYSASNLSYMECCVEVNKLLLNLRSCDVLRGALIGSVNIIVFQCQNRQSQLILYRK